MPDASCAADGERYGDTTARTDAHHYSEFVCDGHFQHRDHYRGTDDNHYRDAYIHAHHYS